MRGITTVAIIVIIASLFPLNVMADITVGDRAHLVYLYRGFWQGMSYDEALSFSSKAVSETISRADVRTSLELITAMQSVGFNNAQISQILSLSLISEMAGTGAITKEAALVLSSIITEEQISNIDWMTLVSFNNQAAQLSIPEMIFNSAIVELNEVATNPMGNNVDWGTILSLINSSAQSEISQFNMLVISTLSMIAQLTDNNLLSTHDMLSLSNKGSIEDFSQAVIDSADTPLQSYHSETQFAWYTLFCDDFNRANNASLGASWVEDTALLRINDNAVDIQ